jgi:hypothetical protein
VWHVPIITVRTEPPNRSDVVLHATNSTPIDRATPDGPNVNTKETENLNLRKGKDRDIDVNRMWIVRTSYNWRIRKNWEGIRLERSVAARSSVSRRATEGHTNQHCTSFVKCWGNRFDLLLRSGLSGRQQPDDE